jgi:hypothetical protein
MNSLHEVHKMNERSYAGLSVVRTIRLWSYSMNLGGSAHIGSVYLMFHWCPYRFNKTASVVQCSEFLATDPEVPGSIPGATRISEKRCVLHGVHSASWGYLRYLTSSASGSRSVGIVRLRTTGHGACSYRFNKNPGRTRLTLFMMVMLRGLWSYTDFSFHYFLL